MSERSAEIAQPNPLFVGLSDDRLRHGTGGCTELSCSYHRRINTELRRRAKEAT